MLSKAGVVEREEKIRKAVRQLSDGRRLAFFRETEQKLKDPDTYATLNFLFLAGLHHFYLGKWLRGSVNLLIFLAGVVLLFTGNILGGILLLVLISGVELYELFRSQLIVQDHNNRVMEAVYRKLTLESNRHARELKP